MSAIASVAASVPFIAGVVLGVAAASALGLAFARRRARGITTLANLLSALRAGDYSVRLARRPRGALGEVAHEFNRLADALHQERLKSQESAALLDDVLAGVEIAVIAFDNAGVVHLANAAAQRLAGTGEATLVGRSLDALGLGALRAVSDGTLRAELPVGDGHFHVRCSHMRSGGRPLQVRLVSDIGKALRDKEEEAWRRLVRVMAHEINNSLAPIQSITDTVARGLEQPRSVGFPQADYAEALRAVGARAASLNRFLQPYSRLARLPQPQVRPVFLAPVFAQVAAVLGVSPALEGAEGRAVLADPALLEQVLVNLLRNAMESGGPLDALTIAVAVEGEHCAIAVRDRGIGVPDSDNLFVPFFTTKPEGSGIGLVLCRQIIEAHGGRLLLRNRADTPGAEALITLPVAFEETQ